MKKILFTALVAGSLMACNSNDASNANENAKDSTVNSVEDRTDSVQNNIQENADSAKARLERKSDSVKSNVKDNYNAKDSIIEAK